MTDSTPSENTMPLPDEPSISAHSPTDRVIGMLLERLEAVRELHDNIRAEADEQRKDVSATQTMLARLIAKLENHEANDHVAFTGIKQAQDGLAQKIDNLASAIQQATTAGLIQKAQIAAGWKVIAVFGAIGTAVIAIFAIFFNHKWN